MLRHIGADLSVHQFRLSSKLMNAPDRVFTSFWLLNLTGYALSYHPGESPRKVRRRGFCPSADFPASVTQAAAGERPSPSGGRFAIRPCPDGFACVVIRAGDGERGGGFDSGSREGGVSPVDSRTHRACKSAQQTKPFSGPLLAASGCTEGHECP